MDGTEECQPKTSKIFKAKQLKIKVEKSEVGIDCKPEGSPFPEQIQQHLAAALYTVLII